MLAKDYKFDFYKGCKFSKKRENEYTLEQIMNICYNEEIDEFRKTKDRALKDKVPAFTPMGKLIDGGQSRSLKNCEANNLIMIDIDHCKANELDVVQFALDHREKFKENNLILAYVTCSGEGLRFILPCYENLSTLKSAYYFLYACGLDEYAEKLDEVCTDSSRLSIITKKGEYFWYNGDVEMQEQPYNEATWEEISTQRLRGTEGNDNTVSRDNSTQRLRGTEDEDKNSVSQCLSVRNKKPNKKQEEAESYLDDQAKPYKDYSMEQIEENDRLYGGFKYKGREVRQIAETYVSYKTKGVGPELGERHALYSMLCKNFRNMCDNDPRILHAVLPLMNKSSHDAWRQCYYYCAVSKSPMLPKDFWYWLKERNFLDEPTADDVNDQSLEEQMYEKFLKEMPALPPIIKEFVKSAPHWFKIPAISTLQCYCGLLATNYRSVYFDGMPISTTLYNLIYAPQASGKGYVRRLRSILKSTDERDMLAINKAKWYDKQQRQNNGSGKLPEEVVWKQRVFAAKTSLGEILKRQEAIGNHHWLQDVGEFSIWAATIKKNKEEWSAFFRTSYDNEPFMQSYQSANAYRGKVDVYPIIHATCTLGQITGFFTNLEDGLLSRFSFIPLLHQRYAKYQPWKVLSDKDQAIIDKTVERLDIETYKGGYDANDKDAWDYEFKEPVTYNMDYCWKPILDWCEEKRQEASKSDNEALDTLRRRCARNAFIYAIICRALFGKDDKATRKKIVENMLWDAEVKLFFMRNLWEHDMIKTLDKEESKKKGLRNVSVFDELPNCFTKTQVESVLNAQNYRTPASKLVSNWKASGFIKETSKYSYKKISK